MKAGLTNLAVLRGHLLAASLGEERRFDGVIVGIGQAVAGLFDRYTNRKLAYESGAVETLTADRAHVGLSRYPIAAVTKVELKEWGDAAYTECTDEPVQINEASGLIYLSGQLGTHQGLLRVTYTGGYWFNDVEPEEGDEGAPPEGATELPADLRGAFLTQCEQFWATHNQMGTLGGDGTPNTRLSTLELIGMVKEMLRGYVRYQMF